ARVIAKKLNIPVYFTYGTWNHAHKSSKPVHHQFFQVNQAITINGMIIHAFSKQHDAGEPCSFRVELEGMSIGVMTDIGEACPQVISHLKQCDALFLESNYDEQLLWNGNYPWPLKKRVASALGHLSNDQALSLLMEHAGPQLKTVFLSHISAENNTPELAFETFRPLHNQMEVLLTSRTTASVVKTYSTNHFSGRLF
ncbi:MAG: MBL fold metallo-hydrolase, partial [Prolixibacteraceae bacterium]|nr:MBL fold metallo-hydrolase [Prolixibacteraceae bacterium]